MTAPIRDAGSDAAIDEAAGLLRAGHVVAIPTDTVYGVAVDPSAPGAIDRIFEAKGRPRDVRLPVLVSSTEQALSFTSGAGPEVLGLMERFWPGGLTIVLERGTNGEGTVGVRCPDHGVPRALCETVGPLATTSANLHRQPTPSTAGEVAAVFGDGIALVLDGGRCEGSPSTVIDCTGPEPRLIREGAVPWTEVLAHYHRR